MIKLAFTAMTFGGVFLWTTWKKRARVRTIVDTPRSKLISAPQGFVEVEGFAWPNDGKVSRSSDGRELVYQNFQLQRLEQKGSGKNSRQEWVTVFRKVYNETFYIVDPTGLAIVDPQSAEFNIDGKKIIPWKKLSAEDQNRVRTQIVDIAVDGFPPAEGFFALFAKQYRIVNEEITVGCPIYITGNFGALDDNNLKVREAGLTTFFAQTMDAGTRSLRDRNALLDENHDGKVSSDEARKGYAGAARAARAKPADEKEFELCGMLSTTPQHKMFIADDHEARLVENLSHFVKLKMAGGFALLAVGIWMGCNAFAPQTAISKIASSQRHPTSDNANLVRQRSKEAADGARAKMLADELSNLHTRCTSGTHATDCAVLVDSATIYSLDANYIKYYADSACRGGLKAYCGR